MSGSCSMAQPSARRCCQPPGQIAGERVLAPSQPRHLEHEVAPRREPLRRQPVDAAEEADVLVDRQELVQREPLRHVADALLHALRIGRHVDAADRSLCPTTGASRPHSMRMVVDLPAPLLPRKPKISPGAHDERHVVDGDERRQTAA